MIEVERLAKQFVVRRGRFRRERVVVEAVREISFSVERGELLGYLGPNGAGKSTTIKMLTGILVPSSGTVSVARARSRRAAHRARPPDRRDVRPAHAALVGPAARRLVRAAAPHLPGPGRPLPRQRSRASARCSSSTRSCNTPVRQLSLGQRIRGELTAAMLHDPELLFLDEPTIGLDVVAKQRVREFLVEINRERGVTVLLTTHDLGDIERLCTRLLVIDHGRLIWDGGIAELQGSLRQRTDARRRPRGAGAAARGRRRARSSASRDHANGCASAARPPSSRRASFRPRGSSTCRSRSRTSRRSSVGSIRPAPEDDQAGQLLASSRARRSSIRRRASICSR